MVINESAYYKGKLWCAYELKDHFGHYKEELRLTMRKESQERKFTCPDCGEPLILCAGPVMEPFFKHYENSNCIINRKEVNRRNVVARRMLYNLAKDSFPEAELELDKKLVPNVISDIWIKTDDTTLVFEYLGYEMKLAAWEEKHNYYQSQGIVDVWFLNYKRYQYEVKTTFEYMVSKTTPVLKFIDYETGELILKQRHELASGRTIFIAKPYPIEEMRIDTKGEAICDYEQYRKEQFALLEYEEKLERLRKQQEAMKRNRVQDSNRKKQEYEQQSIFFESVNRVEQLERKEERSNARVEQLVQKSQKLYQQKDEYDNDTLADVKRYPIDSGMVSSQTMKMTAIDELWELPKLEGKEWQIRKANQSRYLFLKKLNRELEKLSEEERKPRIQQALMILEEHLSAEFWR